MGAERPEGCWAAPLGDCADGISREHYISESLFKGDDQIVVQGFKWCLDEPKTIGLPNLVAKILCRRHNSSLSDLDTAALNAFNVFREAIRLQQVREKLRRPAASWNVKQMVIDGPLLERWFLKTLINLSVGGEWPIGSHAEIGKPSQDLVEIAFGKRDFEHGAGMYVAARAGEQIDSMDRVNFTPMTDEKGRLTAGRFNFRGYRFLLILLPVKYEMFGDSQLLYRETIINWSVQQRRSHRIVIKGWAKANG